ncbi:toll/interleukin-1 receptor domain-containing protein [Streptomyces uncialis]|uniref:toll/interleukin-1 receptor domain-containing protein n=1 Tax=Streptomyces uncialis TaxID=1048205 RepID=UPI002E3596E8|nr:toll/interleukin-1 receptor domain-containing protein [Streptomyces uncialis]
MPMIFVNYRTDDAAATATLVDRELSRVFGDENVFRASKSIEPGSRYPQELLKAVRRSSVLLAVIGPKWLAAGGSTGRSGSQDREDWVRREITEALDTGAVVIPLLVGRTERLRREDLPEELWPLAECQDRRIDLRKIDADLSGLVADLVALLPELAAAAQKHGDGKPAGDPSVRSAPGDDKSAPARMRADVIKHRQRGGIGNLNGDLGTFVSEPQGPVHTGSGHLYQARDQHLGPRISGDGSGINYVADNHGEVDQRSDQRGRPRDAER